MASRSLRQYEAVIDTAALHGWTCHLSKGSYGWQLDIHEGDELIARGRSRQGAPACFRRLGNVVSLALEKSGKLTE